MALLNYLTFTPPSAASSTTFQLISVQGQEKLSTPFTYRLRLVAASNSLDFSTLIGKTATVTLKLTDSVSRYLSGYITRAVMVEADRNHTNASYDVELRPFLWMLNYHSDCRIFQNLTVPVLVTNLLSELGFTDVKNSLTGTYTAREYCVQYNETTFNFINRLFEEEGIFYFFTFTSGVHTLVLGDDPSVFAACVSDSTVNYRSSANNLRDDYTVNEVELEQRVMPAGYGLGSYEFTTPATNLYVKSTGTGTTAALVLNDYLPVYSTTTVGEAIAKLRLEAYEAESKVIRAEGRMPSFQAGYTFTLAGHDRTDLNTTYVLSGLTLEASQSDYLTRFEAFPSTVAFRPKKQAEKPRIFSTLTATVVGKAGEEIWTDSYGRVVIQFPWDRLGKSDENSSIWVRVSQGWAGKAWGSLSVPRVGTEVLVNFIDGDPDKPIVTGTVYNATQTMPYTYPADQTKTTIKTNSSKGGGKFNELRFEDKAGSEEVYIEAAKDMTVTVTNDVNKTVSHDENVTITNNNVIAVNNDRTITVKNNDSRTISSGNDSLTVSTGTRAVSVKGNETHTNSGDFTQTVSGNYKLSVTGNMTIEVTGDLTIKAASITLQSTGTAISATAATSVTIKSGSTMTVQAGTELDASSGTNLSVKGGANLDLEASAQLTASGATTTIKGSANAQVSAGAALALKGAIVQIN
jgi:type VI secretion system secreted protein VgrG